MARPRLSNFPNCTRNVDSMEIWMQLGLSENEDRPRNVYRRNFWTKDLFYQPGAKRRSCRQRQSLATSHVRILSSIEGLWLGPGCSDFADGEKHGEYIARRWLIAKREHVSVALKRKKPAERALSRTNIQSIALDLLPWCQERTRIDAVNT
jgi:hypothetical protein